MNDEATTTTIIPAEPGWRVCEAVSADGDPCADLLEMEVIAWLVTYTLAADGPEGYPTPVTVDIGVVIENLLLRSPEGRYVRPYDVDFGHDRHAAHQAERERRAAECTPASDKAAGSIPPWEWERFKQSGKT